MRIAPSLIGIAAFAFMSAASAQTVQVAPISFSPEMQTSLEEDFGLREAETLRHAVENAVAAALARRGATVAQNGAVSVEIEVIDADPNRPTLQQLAHTPSLDSIRSFSIGGAQLRATLRGSTGQTVEVTHRYYDPSIVEASWRADTWSAARVAIRRFANKVAEAYAELS